MTIKMRESYISRDPVWRTLLQQARGVVLELVVPAEVVITTEIHRTQLVRPVDCHGSQNTEWGGGAAGMNHSRGEETGIREIAQNPPA
jgi:hypothetical protein